MSNNKFTIAGGKIGALSGKLYDTLYGIQTGKRKDDMGWTITV